MPSPPGHLRVVAADHQESHAPILYLQVERGRTGFPRRPVGERPFVIGAGADCDLRLGGRGIPEQHSRISLRDGRPVIEALVVSPPLMINGAACRTVLLSDGDLVQIGRFRLSVEELPPAAQSAAGLVDRLEAELTLLDEFESQRNAGAAALLAAVRQRAEALAPAPPSEPDEFLHDLDSAVALLDEFTEEIGRRLRKSRETDVPTTDAARRLLAAQRKLAAQIASVQVHVVTNPDRRPPLRKVA